MSARSSQSVPSQVTAAVLCVMSPLYTPSHYSHMFTCHLCTFELTWQKAEGFDTSNVTVHRCLLSVTIAEQLRLTEEDSQHTVRMQSATSDGTMMRY